MDTKIFAISDIHGCYDELMALYKQLPINPEKDTMVFLGDHIDRGPDSKKVIVQLMKWKKKYPHWQVLYGNHEDLMLDTLLYKGRIYHSFDLWYQQGGRETLHSYMPVGLTDYEKAVYNPRIPESHILFLASLPRYYETDKYVFCHAGLQPGKTAADTDPYELIWIRDEFIHSKFDWGKKIIFGHTAKADFEPWIMDNKIGIDTAVCPGRSNKLTCLELPTEKFYFQAAFANDPFISRR